MQRRKAFSLIEILFALAILSFAAIALSTVMFTTFRAQDSITNGATARALGERVLERTLEKLTSTAASEETEFWESDHVDVPWNDGVEKIGSQEFRYKVTSRIVTGFSDKPPGTTENSLSHVTVTVEWKEDKSAAVGRGMQRVVLSRLANRVKR